jgi:hypothetical protein
MDLLVRRDAIDRASRPLDSRGLGDLLELARLGEDEVLAVATLRRAYELTDENTVGAYLTNYPDRAPAWNLFMATAEEYNMLEAERISSLVGAFPPEQPTEICGSPFTSRSTARGISDVEATLDRISSSFATSQAPPEPAESASEESAFGVRFLIPCTSSGWTSEPRPRPPRLRSWIAPYGVWGSPLITGSSVTACG